jgi:multimeric flavodoxin WrbA
MKLVAIYGSPRKNGNTDLMMDSFLLGASEPGNLHVERIHVRELKISGCLGCGGCDEKGVCVQRDDMDRVYPLLDAADRVVVASPIYFYGLTGQLKLLVDRSQASFMANLEKKKASEGRPASDVLRKGFLLSAGATRGKRLFECAILTTRYFFDAIGIGYSGEVCFREMEKKGDIKVHPTALADCRNAGREFVKQTSRP